MLLFWFNCLLKFSPHNPLVAVAEPLKALPFNNITPISGRTKPYEPDCCVYPLELSPV